MLCASGCVDETEQWAVMAPSDFAKAVVDWTDPTALIPRYNQEREQEHGPRSDSHGEQVPEHHASNVHVLMAVDILKNLYDREQRGESPRLYLSFSGLMPPTEEDMINLCGTLSLLYLAGETNARCLLMVDILLNHLENVSPTSETVSDYVIELISA
jgi:hypothetical protein